METPQPVNLNNPALIALLRNSKQIMNKVENNDYTTGNINQRALTEQGITELQNEGFTPPTQTQVIDYSDDQVMNSRLPDNVKKAMISNRIPKVSPLSNTFSLDDVSEMVERPMGFPKVPQTKRNINESVSSSDTITISKTELKSMINESLANFFKQSYDNTLTENAIKKTIQMLIKEGKINVKQK